MAEQQNLTTWNSVFKTPWYSFYEKNTWYAMAPSGGRNGAAMLAIDSEENVLLIEVYRRPLDEVCLEIPRGFADAGEAQMVCAMREFEEETGIPLDAAKIRPLGVVNPDSGILASRVGLFLATLPAKFAEPEVDLSEVIKARIIPLGQVRKMISVGLINDSVTIAAIARMDEELIQNDVNNIGIEKEIAILDNQNDVVIKINTRRPDFSFEQYCRNREAKDWRWEFV